MNLFKSLLKAQSLTATDDVIAGEDSRQEAHKEQLKDYGFPEEQDEEKIATTKYSEIDNLDENDQPTHRKVPWEVNEAGDTIPYLDENGKNVSDKAVTKAFQKYFMSKDVEYGDRYRGRDTDTPLDEDDQRYLDDLRERGIDVPPKDLPRDAYVSWKDRQSSSDIPSKYEDIPMVQRARRELAEQPTTEPIARDDMRAAYQRAKDRMKEAQEKPGYWENAPSTTEPMDMNYNPPGPTTKREGRTTKGLGLKGYGSIAEMADSDEQHVRRRAYQSLARRKDNFHPKGEKMKVYNKLREEFASKREGVAEPPVMDYNPPPADQTATPPSTKRTAPTGPGMYPDHRAAPNRKMSPSPTMLPDHRAAPNRRSYQGMQKGLGDMANKLFGQKKPQGEGPLPGEEWTSRDPKTAMIRNPHPMRGFGRQTSGEVTASQELKDKYPDDAFIQSRGVPKAAQKKEGGEGPLPGETWTSSDPKTAGIQNPNPMRGYKDAYKSSQKLLKAFNKYLS